MIYKLNELVSYSNTKINFSKLNENNYISTENMLPNFGGITISSNIPKEGKCISFQKEDILLSNIRPYFKKVFFSNFDGGCSNDVLCLKIKDKNIIIGKYLYYYLSTDSFINYVVSTSKGTKMPRGDKKAILNYEINVHNIYEQQHIVDIIVHLIYSRFFYLKLHFLVAIFLIHLKLLLFFPLSLLESYRWNHQYQHIYPKLKNNHC